MNGIVVDAIDTLYSERAGNNECQLQSPRLTITG